MHILLRISIECIRPDDDHAQSVYPRVHTCASVYNVYVYYNI
jgi:hypothetical protein